MRERDLQRETSYVETLRLEDRPVCDLRNDSDLAVTHRAMESGFGAIVQATLRNEVFRCRC